MVIDMVLYVQMTRHSRSNSNDDNEVQTIQVPTEEGKANTKQNKLTQRQSMKKIFEIWNHFTLLEDISIKQSATTIAKYINAI